MISCKTKGEIELMRKAGQVVGQTIEHLQKYVKPGVTTLELDQIADEYIRSQDCTPAFFKLYDFPGHICISINDEIIHGIPTKRVLKEGDIITLDVGATYKGWNGDSATTFAVGKISEEAEKLLKVTKEALYIGIDQARLGNHLHDIAAAVSDHVEGNGFSVVADGNGGHGIGRKVHEDPWIPHYRQNSRGLAFRRGMCLAIEPMVNAGAAPTLKKSDNWTIATKDGRLSAHFEHSIAVTDSDPIILTLP